jgi:alpha-ketoglutarate-dependent taurine dioxygenase
MAEAIDDLTELTPYQADGGAPLFIQPLDCELRDQPEAARSWMRANQPAIDALLAEAGALLFRGFAVRRTADFAALFEHLPGFAPGYIGGAAPRGEIAPRVFEATQLAPTQVIGLHQEMAYMEHFPARLAFFCRMAPVSGGETLVADMRKVTAALPAAFVEAMERRGVLYTRNFRDREVSTGNRYLDIYHVAWQNAFGTTDRNKALADCAAMGQHAEWRADGSLSAARRARGLIEHPATGERLWFNQIATQLMNPRNGGVHYPQFLAHYGEERPWPFAVSFGDGEPFPDDWMDALYAALDAHEVAPPWSQGDVLMIDNYRTAHGRAIFTGRRDIQVSLFA